MHLSISPSFNPSFHPSVRSTTVQSSSHLYRPVCASTYYSSICVCISPSTLLSIRLSTIYLSRCLSVHSSAIHPVFHLLIYLFIICLPVNPSLSLSRSFNPSTCLFIYLLSIFPSNLSIYQPIQQSIHPSFHQPIHLSVCLSIRKFIHPSIQTIHSLNWPNVPPIFPSVCQSVCLSIYLPTYPSFNPSICLSIYL